MRLWIRLGALAAALALAGAAPPSLVNARAVSTTVVGGASDYRARPGDSLTSVSARFGVDVASLARASGLDREARLALGQRLRIENPHVVPVVTDAGAADAIVVNVPQRMLFLMRGGEVALAHPMAAGRPTWPTPVGEFQIDERAVDKPWVVPPSIQEEMRRQGEPVRTIVPPGPDNPLGRYWLGLSRVGCGIHSTNVPASIYSLRTHGCIRQHPDDAAALFERVLVGERVMLVYQPVLLAALADGRVCLEAHRDAYGLAEPAERTLERLVAAGGLEARHDRARAAEVLAAREGIARDVTRGAAGGPCT